MKGMGKLILFCILVSSFAFGGYQMNVIFKSRTVVGYVNDRLFMFRGNPYVLRYFNDMEKKHVAGELKGRTNLFMIDFQVVEIPDGKIYFFCKSIKTDENAEIGVAKGDAWLVKDGKTEKGRFIMVKSQGGE